MRRNGPSHDRSGPSASSAVSSAAESSWTGSGGTTSSTESGRTSVTTSGSRCSVISRLGDCANCGVTSTGIQSPSDDCTSVHAARSCARHTPASHVRSSGLGCAETRADDDARREAELPGDERRGHGELLVVADCGDVVARGLGARIGLPLEKSSEERVDPGQRMTGGARLERVVGKRRHPRGGVLPLRQPVAEVAPLAQQGHESCQRRTAGAGDMLLDPGPHAVRRRDAFADPAGGVDGGQVDRGALDPADDVGSRRSRARRRRSARRPRPPRCSRTGRRAMRRGRPRTRPSRERPTVGIQIPSEALDGDQRLDGAALTRIERRRHPHEPAGVDRARAAAAVDLAVVGVEGRQSHPLGQGALGRDGEEHLVRARGVEQRPVLGERAHRGRELDVGSCRRPQHLAIGAPRRERHDRHSDDQRHRHHAAAERGAASVGARRSPRDPDPAGGRGPLERPDALVVRPPREPQQAREQRREPERGLHRSARGRPDRARATGSRTCGRRTARTRPCRWRRAPPHTPPGRRATPARGARRFPPGTRSAREPSGCGTTRRADRR